MDLGEGVSGPEAKKSQKSLEKSLPGPGPKSPKKVSKKVRKVKKKSENGFLEAFRTFFETFFRPRAGRLFRDFLAFGPKTPSPRSTEPQKLGIRPHSRHQVPEATSKIRGRRRLRPVPHPSSPSLPPPSWGPTCPSPKNPQTGENQKGTGGRGRDRKCHKLS